MLLSNVSTLFSRILFKDWTAKDYIIVLVSAIVLIVLKTALPKLFKSINPKALDAVAWGITTLFMLVLLIVT